MSIPNELNFNILKQACLNFNPNTSMCQICKFHVEHPTCHIWHQAFGINLAKEVTRHLNNGVAIDAKFVLLWKSRVIPAVEVESSMYPRKRDREENSFTVPTHQM